MSAVFAMVALAASPASAQRCPGAGGFPAWLEGFKQEAAAQGISADALAALDGVGFDQGVVNSDRGQGVFSQSFLEFAGRMVAKYRMDQGRQLLRNTPTPSTGSSAITACPAR